MSHLDPDARAILEAARTARPAAAARARIDAGLTAKLVPPPTAAPPPAAVAGPLAGPLAKVVLTAALAGGLATAGAKAGSGVLGPHAAESPRPAPSAEIAPATPAQHATAEEPAPVTAPPVVPSSAPARASARAAQPRAPRAPAAAPEPSSLDEELATMRSAQQALKEGDGARALSQLDALAARHPEGVLREERLAARVLALCAAGRVEEAREAGRRFVAEMPGSVQVDRVRASCAFTRREGEER